MHRYIFYLQPDRKGFILDSMYELTSPDLSGDALKVALKIDPDLVKKDQKAFTVMTLRSRFAMTKGPFLVRTEIELSRETLQMVLDVKSEDGTLRDWLKAARVRASP
jgi:hypothetical protein